TAPTEIPHLAFTQHRVGIHDLGKPAATASKGPTRFTPLTPFLDWSGASAVDKQRSLGMAYLAVANMTENPAVADDYRRQALRLMKQVRAAGLRDGALDATLARLLFDVRQYGVVPIAKEALEDKNLDPQERCNALFLVAEGLADAGQRKEALPLLRELITL